MDIGYLEEALKSYVIVVLQAVSALAEIEAMKAANASREIGRASCRERV